MNSPLFKKLSEFKKQKRRSFSMPGHKGHINKQFINLDVTELNETADLHSDCEVVKSANNKIAKVYNTKQSFIMTSGSTTAIYAMLLSVLKPGDTILLNEDSHISVINACTVIGIKIRILEKEFNDDFLIPGKVEDISKYLLKYSDISAVLITSPNYYGVVSDTKNIYTACKKHGIPLLIDAAHGAHFFVSDKLPQCATRYADLVCHSAHKTLNALTGASYLHVCSDRVSADRVRECINMLETSSPSYPIAVSAESAVDINNKDWENIIELSNDFKKKISKLGLLCLDNDDTTRIVINFYGFNITGFKVLDELSKKYSIDAEMADMLNIVLIVTPKNTVHDFKKLYLALLDIIKNTEKAFIKPSFKPFKRDGIIDPKKAFFADKESVYLNESIGRISAKTVISYPPGTPIIITGEKITNEHIDMLLNLISSGAKVMGVKDNKIDVIME